MYKNSEPLLRGDVQSFCRVFCAQQWQTDRNRGRIRDFRVQ